MASSTTISQPIFFVESNRKYNPSFVKLPKITQTHKFNTRTSTLSINCFFNSSFNNNNSSKSIIVKQNCNEEMKIKENPMLLTGPGLSSDWDGEGLWHVGLKFCLYPFEVLGDVVGKALKGLQRPAVAALLVGLVLVVCDRKIALAASGGRMGGRSFSSRSSSSSSSSASREYIGGPSYLYSAMPYFAPSPFRFSGGAAAYVGPAVGVGSSFFYVMMGFTSFVLVSGFLSSQADGGVLTATEKTSVVKLQVGLLGMARSLQRDLSQIAEAADTSSPEGLHYVLTETILAMLRHPSYCISAYSSVDVKRSIEEGEKQFNQLSIEERGKFDEETLVNVNNIRKQTATLERASGFSNEYIVITILVATEGVFKFSTINNSGDLNDALQKLASIPSSRAMAVEVLWTPQNENDILSEHELLEDYPLLRPL